MRAVLALHRGQPVTADRLIDIIWGEDLPGNPANALQALVATMRRAVGSAKVATSDAGYALLVTPDELDVARFECLVADGSRDLQAGHAGRASDTFHEALALCRDEPLAEFAYAEFATGERARLQELVLVATEGRVDADLALGRHAELVGELEALCDEHPLRERLWELRMVALYRSGRQADALRVYADARERLIEEFGLEPGPGLRALEARVLDQDPDLDLPGTRQPGAPPTSMGNLRQRLTSFVGRDEDLGRLIDSVESSRLVTLIGPGGAGKTRLAVEGAASLGEASRFDDGVWLVELAGVNDAGAVASAVAASLQIARSEAKGASTLDLIVTHIRDRRLLVVLDNCEHLIDEAAAVADTLLGEAPGMHVIATSREALAVPGELLFPVRGLDLDAAVAMFVDRAAAVRPGFSVGEDSRRIVEDVCRRLDGLPLAVELAAARLRALPLAQLADLLDDRFRVLTGGARTALPRQQTLRAVVDWSYDLLFEDERRLFARLSVFAGGWTLDAAEAVCADELLPPTDIIDLLRHLVDKSLVVADFDSAGEVRFSQLQTLLHYARERLAELGEGDDLRHRHAGWYLSLARGARQGLRGSTGPAWRARLLSEWANLRAALDWFVDSGDADSALWLTEGIAWAWFLRDDPHEAARWLEYALAVPGGSTEARAAASMWHAYYNGWLIGPAAAVAEAHEAIAALRGGPMPDRLGDALLLAAELHMRQDDRDRLPAVLAEASDVLHQVGDEWLLAAYEVFVAQSLAATGDIAAAESAAVSSVARFRSLGEKWLIFESLGFVAIIKDWRDDLDAAADAYTELIAASVAANLPNYETHWTVRLALVKARQGDDDAAVALYDTVASRGLRPVNKGWVLIGRAGSIRRRGDLAGARVLLDEALALYASIGSDLGRSAALIGLCWWTLDAGDLEGASCFVDEAARLAAVEPRSRVAAAAAIAAAAVACSGSGTAEDREAFVALVEKRAHSGEDEYVGLLSGSLGDHFDDADVAAFIRSLRAEAIGG